MTAFYLWLNAGAYALLGLWCALRLDATSAKLGYTLSDSGRIEYLTVYGGLQWGLALAFGYLASRGDLHRVGVAVAIAIYLPLVLHRAIGLLRFGPGDMPIRVLAAVEVAMLAWALLLWWRGGR